MGSMKSESLVIIGARFYWSDALSRSTKSVEVLKGTQVLMQLHWPLAHHFLTTTGQESSGSQERRPMARWHGGAMGMALDLRLIGRGFKSYSEQRCVTTLGKLFIPMCLCHQAV